MPEQNTQNYIVSPEVDRYTAKCQGDFFEHIAKYYNFEHFIPAYMASSFVNDHLDKGSVFDFMYPPEMLAMALEFSPELKEFPEVDGQFNRDVAYFMGETCRMVVQRKRISSKELYETLPISYILNVYVAYHTFTDDEYLVDRIYEDFLRKRRERNVRGAVSLDKT